jgi:hypothetical protein
MVLAALTIWLLVVEVVEAVILLVVVALAGLEQVQG